MPRPNPPSPTTAFSAARLPATFEVTIRAIPRGKTRPVLRYSRTHTIEIRTLMSDNQAIGKVSVGHHARISEVYGAYSSHEVHVSVEIPVTREELLEFEGVAEHFQDRCVALNRSIFNKVLASVGKEAIFGQVEAPDEAD